MSSNTLKNECYNIQGYDIDMAKDCKKSIIQYKHDTLYHSNEISD